MVHKYSCRVVSHLFTANGLRTGRTSDSGEEIPNANPIETNVNDKSTKCYMLQTVVVKLRGWIFLLLPANEVAGRQGFTHVSQHALGKGLCIPECTWHTPVHNQRRPLKWRYCIYYYLQGRSSPFHTGKF